MNIKKIFVITIVALTVLSCLSVASAGWFDFSASEPTPTTIYARLHDTDNSIIKIVIEVNESGKINTLKDKPVYVNLTDENGEVTSYNLTTNRTIGGDPNYCAVIEPEAGTYVISAYFPGDENYTSSSRNVTLDVVGKTIEIEDSSSETTETYSNDENPFEDIHHVDTSTSIDSLVEHDWSHFSE